MNVRIKNKLWSKHTLKTAAMIFFIFCMTFIFLSKSPVSIWRCAEDGTDTWVFKTVALTMHKGGMPYLDSFDHKGPLLYILNYWGNLISYLKGIWVIEFGMDFMTFITMYKIARLICGKLMSLFSMLCGIFLLFSYFDGGNLTEEYAMAFISVALYIFLDYFVNNKITNIRLVICGFSCGAVFLLRPNMISVWLVFCVAVLVQCINSKAWKNLKSFIILFLFGFMLIVIPIVIWLGVNEALIPCFNQYIIFNMAYSSHNSGTLFENRWLSFFKLLENIVLVISLLIVAWLCTTKDKKWRFIGITYMLYLLISLFLITIPGKLYGHYAMILVPSVVFPIAKLAGAVEKVSGRKEHGIGVVIAIYMTATLIMPNWIAQMGKVGIYFANRDQTEYSMTLQNAVSFIVKNTDETDKISVYGNYNILYVLSKREHATLYSYQRPIGTIDPRIKKDYFNQLEKERPILLVLQKDNYDETIANFLSENNYYLVWHENEGDNLHSGMTIYKLSTLA